MTVVIRIICAADGSPVPESGCYVKRYQADGYGGRGRLVATDDIARARHYRDFSAAAEDWRRISGTHPVRPDGKPNRPMTAYTVEMIPAPDA